MLHLITTPPDEVSTKSWSDLPPLVSFLFFGASWVNVLLREGNGSNCVERREDLGLFQEEQPSQMGTIFLVTESKRGIVREGPYQFRITLLSLLWGTVYLSGSAATLLTLGRKGGRAWPRAMFQQPSFSANNGQEWIFITDGFPGKLRGRYFILEMSLEILLEVKASRLRVTRGCISRNKHHPQKGNGAGSHCILTAARSVFLPVVTGHNNVLEKKPSVVSSQRSLLSSSSGCFTETCCFST